MSDYDGVYPLINELTGADLSTFQNACGGFYIGNYVESDCCAETHINDLYKTIQVMCTDAQHKRLRRMFMLLNFKIVLFFVEHLNECGYISTSCSSRDTHFMN